MIQRLYHIHRTLKVDLVADLEVVPEVVLVVVLDDEEDDHQVRWN